jgi:hypothetical protein
MCTLYEKNTEALFVAAKKPGLEAAAEKINHMSIFQYSETNVINLLFNLSRIKGLYMFHASPAHPQETLHTTPILVQPIDIACTHYTKCRVCSAS